jgi:hypothetical protein
MSPWEKVIVELVLPIINHLTKDLFKKKLNAWFILGSYVNKLC